ncbi:MAG: hypothetical protein PHH85_10725 [Candidatus Methanoperedens sp.]|nr:hypothetical protein [Candidatus Methanoperedens sp.]
MKNPVPTLAITCSVTERPWDLKKIEWTMNPNDKNIMIARKTLEIYVESKNEKMNNELDNIKSRCLVLTIFSM